MSERDSPKRRLDRRIDAALASWPVRGVKDSVWEEMARRVEGRLLSSGAAVRGSVDDDVLKPPLPATPHEMQESAPLAPPTPAPGERMSSMPPSERDRDRRSLKDLAKLAASPSLTPGPPSSKGSVAPPPFGTPGDTGDSGIVDLKKMTEFQPGALGRPQGTPPPPPFASSRPIPAIAPPALPSAPGSAPYSAPPPFPLAAPAPVVARGMLADEPSPFARKKRSGLAWTVGIGATLAAAAAAFLVLRSQPMRLIADNPPPPPRAATAAPTPASDPVASAAAPSPSAASPPPEAVAKVDTPAPAEDHAAEPSHAPSPANPAAGSQRVAVASVAAVPKKGGAAAKAAPANPALVAKNIPTSAPQSGSLSDALRQAAGPMEAPAAPAGGGASAPSTPVDTGSNVPQKPSQGAIASGVGSSLTQARACLSSDNPISHANITFDSTGSVTNVSITGFAAGKPVEACIKAALKRARVPAFAQPTYTTGVTVRPTG